MNTAIGKKASRPALWSGGVAGDSPAQSPDVQPPHAQGHPTDVGAGPEQWLRATACPTLPPRPTRQGNLCPRAPLRAVPRGTKNESLSTVLLRSSRCSRKMLADAAVLSSSSLPPCKGEEENQVAGCHRHLPCPGHCHARAGSPSARVAAWFIGSLHLMLAWKGSEKLTGSAFSASKAFSKGDT